MMAIPSLKPQARGPRRGSRAGVEASSPKSMVIAVRTLLLAAVLMAAWSTAPAVAQDFQAQPQAQGRQPLPGFNNGDMTPAEIQKLFDAYLVMEAQQALALTDEQYPQFLTRLRALQETRRRNQQERFRVMGELQRLSNPRQAARGDDALIKDRLATLQELESRTAAELRKAYNALDEVLDLRQQARFRIFEEQIERRKIELLLRARQQNRPNQPNRPNQQQPPIRRPPPLN